MGSFISQIQSKLDRHSPGALPGSKDFAHAAVSIILREEVTNETQVLIIRRAEDPRDPWSGHMGFPGGHVDASDASPECAAVRETQEELGISLEACAERLGQLSEIQARARSKPIALSIFPFVYHLVRPVSFLLNSEVIEALWIPLALFLSPENRSGMRHPDDECQLMPCYRVGDRFLWGLSLAMLDELLALGGNGPKETL